MTEKQDKQNEHAVSLLNTDVAQLFTHMRHYDDQIWEITKFTFTSYVTLFGIAIGLYQFGIEKGLNLKPAVQAVLVIMIAFGLFTLWLAARNRAYYVPLARYINECRQAYLRHSPLGIQNNSGIYTNPNKPSYFNWNSTQLWLATLISALNAFAATFLAHVSLGDFGCKSTLLLVIFFFSFLLQALAVVIYLKTKEKRSTKGNG